MKDNLIVIQNFNRIDILWVVITNILAMPTGENEHGWLALTKQINVIKYHGRHFVG
jgi:hypothetical protein